MLSLEDTLSVLDRLAELLSVEHFIGILQKCRKKQTVAFAKRAHAHICNNGLDVHRVIGNYVVPMFVERGSLSDAQQVFNKLVHRSEHSWTFLIVGCIQCGKVQQAFKLYQKMQEDRVSPTSFTLMALLKACAMLKDVERGREVHAEIALKGLVKNIFVGNTLVDMYAKCGSLLEARQAFDWMPVRDVVSWNVLIAGYAEHGTYQEAMTCFKQMQMDGTSPNAVTLVCVLKACGSIGATDKGQEVHASITEKGFEKDLFVSRALVDMYSKCGTLCQAQRVFDKLPVRDVVSWTSLLAGYAEHGLGQVALKCFKQMQLDGVSPNAVTFVCTLKACSSIKAVGEGRQLHAEVIQEGLERDPFVGSALVALYAKCGSLSEAQEVFDTLQDRDISWNALLSGYVEHGTGQQALKCFELMQLEDAPPNSVTFICALKACSSIGAIRMGRQLHSEISQKGFTRDLSVGNALVLLYAKCGSLAESQEVFDKLPVRDVVSWTTLIAAYAEYGPAQEAVKCFEQMLLEGLSPNAVTLLCILKACGSTGAIEKGREIHAEIAEKFGRDLCIGNMLIDMYAKCGSLSEAREVFDKLPDRDVVSWTALIAGYAEHGPVQEVLKFFERMQLEGVSPNAITLVCVLKACGSIGAIDKGREIHAEIASERFGKGLSVGSSLVVMYAKCGSLSEAHEVFDKLPVRNIVLWSALIAGYAEHGPGQEALKCFEEMRQEGISPDAITYASVLKACGRIGAICMGREIHTGIAQKGFGSDVFVGSTLVDMYSKCSSISEAREVFDKLPDRNVVAWSAIIKGYGMNCEGNMAVHFFEDMQEQGVKPDATTFTCLLSACSHANLVFKGQEYFQSMRETYGIAPTRDHYTCMIDLLARSGHLCEAQKVLETMGSSPSEETWTSLLSACKTYGEGELGLRCFHQLVQMNSESAASYVLMANIYTSGDSWYDALKVEELRKHAGAKKQPASAIIEVNKKVNEFVVGNDQTKETSALLEIWSSRMKGGGHVPHLDLVLKPRSYVGQTASLLVHA